MTVHKCYAFHLKRKIVYRPLLVRVPRFFTLSEFIVAGQPLQYGEVRDSYWCEWMLWSQQPSAHVSFGYTV